MKDDYKDDEATSANSNGVIATTTGVGVSPVTDSFIINGEIRLTQSLTGEDELWSGAAEEGK